MLFRFLSLLFAGLWFLSATGLRRYISTLGEIGTLLAGVLPSALTAICMALWFLSDNPNDLTKPIARAGLLSVLIEFVQLWFPTHVFDIYDVAAALAGCATVYLLLRIQRFFQSLWTNQK